MTEVQAEPWFTHDEPFTQFKAKDIASAIARGGVPYPTAAARFQNYVKSEQIAPRAKSGNAKANSANLYAFADVCVAMMLSNLQDCGIADHDLLKLASVSLYGWNVGAKPRSHHPILAAASDTWGGNPWALQLDFYRHPEADHREINRAFYPLGSRPIWSQQRLREEPVWLPIGTVLITTAVLNSLQRLVSVPEGAN